MRLRVLSDLHLEWEPLTLAPAGEDVLILAGDIATSTDAVMAAKQMAAALMVPVIAVAGNHEFYRGPGDRHTWQDTLDDMRAAADHTISVEPGNVTFLENGVAIYRGIRFIGATLWTDMQLFGDDPLVPIQVAQRLHDYRAIVESNDQPLQIHSVIARHQISRQFIADTLAQPFDGATVVITHHTPSWLSIPSDYREDRCSAGYSSRMEFLIERGKPQLWIHGHTHTSFDYQLFDTRIVCNPRGYRDENQDFDQNLIIEI